MVRLPPVEAAKDVWAVLITRLERDHDISSRCWRDGCMSRVGDHNRRPQGIDGVDDRHNDPDTSESQRVVTAGHNGGVNTKVSVITHDIHHRSAQSTGLGLLYAAMPFRWHRSP